MASYQRIAVVDAWGTLAIPGGNFEVLRTKQTEYISASVDVKVSPLGWIDISTIGGQQVLPLGTDTVTSFHFLNDMSKEPIAVCTLNTAQNTVTGVRYKAVNLPVATLTPSFDELFCAYPNPVEHTLFVRCTNLARATYRLRLVNTLGDFILERKVESASTESYQSIPVSSLTPGVYELVLLRDGAPVGRTRVVKN